MRTFLLAVALLFPTSLFAATTSNDDSCDIALQPAATLLLPYFEVDFNSPQGAATQTLFTVQNVSNLPQIAHVTLWTDWGYPAVTLPLFLTGYDVQGINLYDVFAHGSIAPGGPIPGTSYDNPIATNPTLGSQPAANGANPHFFANVPTACAKLPVGFGPALLADLQQIFTTGTPVTNLLGCPPLIEPTRQTVKLGGAHANAIGYATIDVVATCAAINPTASQFYGNFLLYDNVLTGDYQQVVPRAEKSYAQGGPLVHIRAIPEGGTAGAQVASVLPHTFYERYTTTFANNRTIDRRQPLPSVLAPRYIELGGFKTTLKIWREGLLGGSATCTEYSSNGRVPIVEFVRFDEHENATITTVFQPFPAPVIGTPLAFAVPNTNTNLFPPISTSGDVGGWLYLNFGRPGWVITSMFAEPTYATEAPAIALGNGCSPAPKPGTQIGPTP